MTKRERENQANNRKELASSIMRGIDPSLPPEELQGLLASNPASKKSSIAADGHLLRWQDKIIEQIIPDGASVLDLGCGNGELLEHLIDNKNVHGQGAELDPYAVLQCVERGVPVFQTDLDRGLTGFPDQSFDYVVLEETLQTLHRPIRVLEEMLRIGQHGIVSFPNFGYWRVRLELTLRGHMPCTEWLPYQWYDTPNIHLFTIQDFEDWAGENEVIVTSGHVLTEDKVRELMPQDNLYAEEVLLVVEKAKK